MMSPTRTAAGLLAGGLALGALGGCTVSSDGVSCSTSSCTVTLDGEGAQVEVFGNTLSLGSVRDGRAALEVAGASVSCAEGESVAAGPLSVECTSVTESSVQLTASLG